jgi:hypothetical protein
MEIGKHTMKLGLKSVSISGLLLLSSIALAQDPASTEPVASSKPEVIIAKGKVGQAPVQVIYDYLADRITNEYGVSEYQNLQIKQKSAGAEDFTRVSVEVLQSGLLDDAVAAQRYRFNLAVNEELRVWEIKSVTQDWQCRRGNKKAWTQKPCK